MDLNYTGTGAVEAEVVFVGYGISAPDRAWDDYDGVDVKGKLVLALRGAPTARDSEFALERQIGAKSSVAIRRAARAAGLYQSSTYSRTIRVACTCGRSVVSVWRTSSTQRCGTPSVRS